MEREWTANPDEDLKIPKEHIEGLKYEIVILTEKKPFTFRCRDYNLNDNGSWYFDGIIIDTSKKDPKGNLVLKRLTYHPYLVLANIGFMVIPAYETSASGI